MAWLFALGLLAVVLATSSPAAQTSGTAVLAAGGRYELVAVAPNTTGELDWRLPAHQAQLVNEMREKGAESVTFASDPARNATRIRLVQVFPEGGSIPIGTAIFSNAKLESVRRLG